MDWIKNQFCLYEWIEDEKAWFNLKTKLVFERLS